jgi:hypothetical protein
MSLWKSSLILSFLVLFITNVFALEVNDKLQANIIRIHESNIIIISRGLEDGIEQGDHAKLIAPDGYAARALCLKTGMLSSYWKLYRITNPELISKDYVYNLIAIDDKEVSPEMMGYKQADLSSSLPESDPIIEKKETAVDKVAVNDHPEDLTQDEAVLNAKRSVSQAFMARNFNSEQFSQDFQKYDVSIFAAPISETVYNKNKTQSLNYGTSINNMGEKYELSASLYKNETKNIDAFSGTTTTNGSTNANITFDINRITPKISYFMYLNYAQARYGELYTPRSHIDGGPVGFKYYLYEGETLKRLDVSYIPVWDQRISDFYYFDPITFQQSIKQTKINGIRHSLRLRLRAQFTPTFSITNTTWYKPFMNPANWKIDEQDQAFKNTFTIGFKLTENLFFDYTHTYTYDIILKRISGISPFSTTQAINLRFNFQI